MARTKQTANQSTGGRARAQRTRRNRQTEFVIPKLPFQRLVREIAQDYKSALRFQRDALLACQEGTEDFMTKFMKVANRLAAHAKRKTLKSKDICLTRIIVSELH